MESDIKVKATERQMETFCKLYCVKWSERIKWLNDSKSRYLYDVTLRHNDEAGELRGTYTVETLMKKFREDADVNMPWLIGKTLKECASVLSVFGEENNLTDVINAAFEREGFNLKVA